MPRSRWLLSCRYSRTAHLSRWRVCAFVSSPHGSQVMANENRKIGVVAATFLVAGNMMGSGVFLLPGSLAKIGSVSMWGWVVTTIGALLLAFVFAKLGRLAPKAGGPYAYARDAFGPYMGFQTNTIYWFANWIGNVAL